MLQQWEAGDPEVRQLWLQVRQWVLDGWKQTEELLGFTFDKVYFESDVYQLGKDIIEAGLAKGVFRKNEKGNIVFDLPQEQFGTDEEGNAKVITVLRADGTSLYYTQDLGLQTSRVAEYHLDRIVHVVGSEQNFYFQALFAMFKALGYAWAEKLYHLSYAMVYLPEGKMKSREGTVVDVDDLIQQMIDLAKQEITDRMNRMEGTNRTDNIDSLEVERRAQIIALGAIKFYMLKQKPTTDIYFDPKESISFEGHTGPYCQYAYARAKSIVRQVDSGQRTADSERINYSLLGDTEERILLQKLEQFPEVVTRAAEEYNPALVATHVFETAQAFNTFYTTHPVAKAETESLRSARLVMVQAAAQVIHNGLAVLGIQTLEQM
jgi:arginyl-tRNA synthetase